MTTIGTFAPSKDGFLRGTIRTLTLNLTKVTLEPVTSDHESAPAFRIFANGLELGAAWAKTAKESGRVYHQVRLDDASFPAPDFATLIENEEGSAYSLIWTRPKPSGARVRRGAQGRR